MEAKSLDADLRSFLDEHINEDTDTSKISVFPIPCGVGKSEYITYLLADALQNHYGLIVVTDTLDRLNKYASSQQNEQLSEYIQRNISKISILNFDNIADEITTLHLKPIILMTTQRYFNLTREEIIKLTANHICKRSKIVFDEKIYLLESRKLTVKTLNDIATALSEGLDNTVDEKEKKYLITEYEELNQELQKRLVENEQQNNDLQNFKREVWFDSNGLTITDRFNTLISKYKNQLKRYNSDILKDLRAINKLLFDGVITSQKVKTKKSNQDYKNYFTVVINNADKLVDIGSKVFVLDGSADISPEYLLNCIDMVDCSQFNRDLSKLSINVVNVNTSKTKLESNDDKTQRLIRTIIDYIKSQPNNIDTVFTYQSIEKYFENEFEYVNHFGNIKGRNNYRNVKNICQVGLNRWSELIYMLYANEIGYYNDFNKSHIKRIYDLEHINNIRCRLILADIEQNLFRCKIRNIDNTDSCIYTLICSIYEKSAIFKDYQPLIDMLKSRYEKLGATVNVIDTPTNFKLFNMETRKQDTQSKRILDWLSNKDKGFVFKISAMKKDLSMSDKQFEKIKSKNKVIDGLFKKMSTNKKGYYQIL